MRIEPQPNKARDVHFKNGDKNNEKQVASDGTDLIPHTTGRMHGRTKSRRSHSRSRW